MVPSAVRLFGIPWERFYKVSRMGQALRDSGLMTEGGAQHCFLLFFVCFLVSFPRDSTVQAILRITALSNHIYDLWTSQVNCLFLIHAQIESNT